MQANIQQIYQQSVSPLSEQEQLRLAALIINKISNTPRADSKKQTSKGDITKFSGMYQDGDPNGSDNERIDTDLARAYADNYEDEE